MDLNSQFTDCTSKMDSICKVRPWNCWDNQGKGSFSLAYLPRCGVGGYRLCSQNRKWWSLEYSHLRRLFINSDIWAPRFITMRKINKQINKAVKSPNCSSKASVPLDTLLPPVGQCFPTAWLWIKILLCLHLLHSCFFSFLFFFFPEAAQVFLPCTFFF